VFWGELFRTSSLAISLFWQVLVGWAITSAAIFSAMFFNKAQMSGIWSVIGFIIVALCGQIMDWGSPKTATVAAMSFLFPSMNYIFFTGYMCRYEEQGIPTDMLRAAKTTHDEASSSRVPGIILWVFLLLQIVIYPLIAILAERWIHGSKSKARTVGISSDTQINSPAIEASGLTKIYPPTFWKKWFTWGKKDKVIAVENLDLVARNGQILCLLGANGSGKTTTLDMLGGLQKLTSGTIHVNAAPSQIGQLYPLYHMRLVHWCQALYIGAD
jgi:ATP-binding cassette, subfamily A (ABC1), member 3